MKGITMAASHKKSGAYHEIRSSLPPARIAAIAKQVADNGGGARFEGADGGDVHFSIRGLIKAFEVMTFVMRISADQSGTVARTSIRNFKTSQEKFMLIPVSPKSLEGFSAYKKFGTRVAEAVRAEDPAAVATFVDREVVAR